MQPRPLPRDPEPAETPVDSRLIHEATILLVDDDEFINAMAQAYLEHAGFDRIETATNGQACLDRLYTGTPPEIVILDIQMPVRDGLDVLRQMREDRNLADIPVLVTTGSDESQQRNEAIRAGASSLISKPFDAQLLIEKTRSLIERQLLIRELNLYRERVSRELAAAQELQHTILPSQATIDDIERRYGCRITSRFQSSSELAGDFWGLRAINATQFAVYSIDISGHGVGAAANTFRLHEIIASEDMTAHEPAEFLSLINRRFHERVPAGHFATILYGIVDVAHDTFRYASAASPPPLIGRAGTKPPTPLENKGMLAGAMRQASFRQYETAFEPQDYLFLYSDALPEALTPDGEMLGDEAPAELLTLALAQGAEDPLTPLMEDFVNRTKPGLHDDLTLIFIERVSQSETA